MTTTGCTSTRTPRFFTPCNAPTYRPNAMSDPTSITTTTWISKETTSVFAGAPMARRRVSADAFWNVTMRKNNPVTSGTTR